MNKYLVLAMRTPRFDTAVIEPHRQFLRSLQDRGQLQESGRFTDGTGGAYVIYAESLAAAREIAFTDPVHTTGSSELTIYEWEVTAPN
ncbi:YciI family protein [Nocardia implantans]|uniref:YciI family protein n=1 Tax=Nocardia implantans TaxID=3108168 RepID=A0ABU6B0F2_9NOCA|nr:MULTISPECIES: YciI family protein [unclassified Nocardia]MEA3530695.1 YciI family protein [Nocardia sp. CDC192]MEB3513175.1 YciI family protein [Nocardia sp. CDC186]